MCMMIVTNTYLTSFKPATPKPDSLQWSNDRFLCRMKSIGLFEKMSTHPGIFAALGEHFLFT
jgi:hypothetical protein